MSAPRRNARRGVLNRPLGSLAACIVAAWGLAIGVHASPAQADQARPVIDTDFLYHQLYYMSSNYLYRVSGQDGDPRNPSDPANQPPQANGWQEFYAYWKKTMTDPKQMGPLGGAVTPADHYFQSGDLFGAPGTAPPFESDVAEVTLPGSTCPGERTLFAAHPDSTPGLNQHNGSAYDDTSGVSMGMAEFRALLQWYAANGTWPARTVKIGLFDAEETGLYGSAYYADNLIPQGPQGQYKLVANMDQNGLEYPAYHFGTQHFTSNPTGTTGPWQTNINASPLKKPPTSVYTDQDWARIQANMPAIQHFRQVLDDSVHEAFSVLGAKHHNQITLENPLENGAKVPAYTAADLKTYSTPQDDTLGRTDQVPFVAQGIPGYGVLGAFDSTDTENPFPQQTPVKPPIFQYAGYDTPRDTIQHLNLLASGQPQGPATNDPAVPESGTEELRAALELPATWSDYLVSRDEYAGASPRPAGPLAYFETNPVKPAKDQLKVDFDASFTRPLDSVGKLTYAWDFGDGAHATGEKVSHTYAHPQFADAKLVVQDENGAVGTYRQAVNAGASSDPAPDTPSCGRFKLPVTNGVLAENNLPPATTTPNPLGLPSNHKCVDRRRFTFKIHQPRHGRVTRVTVFVNGKRVLRLHRHRIAKITIPRLPIGLFQVKIVAVNTTHETVTSVRTYRGCKKGQPTTHVQRPPHHRNRA
ncbi:MAG: bacterial leucyl aminopeptidase [Thermoleophilaceae bacterium]|nr:bacterial leucyl aminopeptidase [Thermoleophilaceae bacterium]